MDKVVLTSDEMNILKNLCDTFVKKIVDIAIQSDSMNSNNPSEIADKSVRLTLAYFMKYGIMDLSKFAELNIDKI